MHRRHSFIRGGIAIILLAVGISAGTALPPSQVQEAKAANPGAIFTCDQTDQFANIDPIVSPGGTSAHEHAFFGAIGVDSTETSAELRAKPTSCLETGNHSAFWMPSVWQNGVRLAPGPKEALIYYRCQHNTTVCAGMQSFPEDYAQVMGNTNATTAAENPAFNGGLGGWRCGIGGGTLTPTPPTTCANGNGTPGILVASVTFGNCLFTTPNPDVVDFRLNAQCTNNGGQPIVRIQQYFRWQLTSSTVGTISIGGPVIGTNGAKGPLTLHSDYFFGWESANFTNFLNQCIRVNVDCGTNPNV